ncbi:MAG: hypothetical protein LBT46_04885 [Planctomycetaceae bacterium]|nr:hypothetical protein [Planctomycetaceae bacterium]
MKKDKKPEAVVSGSLYYCGENETAEALFSLALFSFCPQERNVQDRSSLFSVSTGFYSTFVCPGTAIG